MPQRDKTEEDIIELPFPPGITRDGTVLSAKTCVDGQWVRWRNGRFLKMGGRVAGLTQTTGSTRGLHLHWNGSPGYVHVFSRTKVERLTVTSAGVFSSVTDRTPSGFTNDANNGWQFDVMFDEGSAANTLIAHCTENLGDPGSGTARPIYYGDITGTSALASTGQNTDGGIMVLQPYLVYYGSAGEVGWGDANSVTNFASGDAGSDRITGAKLLRGLPTRGSSTGPAGLLWSQDSLIQMSYVGGAVIFQFKDLSKKISVLSSNGIVEFEGRYYWPAVDRFMTYDGTVRVLKNPLNRNWFYDNLNFTHRQKVWATVVPSAGEIWWFYPRSANTECSHAVIYNVYESEDQGRPVWYDVELARSAGHPPGDFRFPLWAGTDTPCTLWRHETGADEVDFAEATNAIDSYIEGPVLSQALAAKLNNWTAVKRVELDGTQTGDMDLIIRGREYARSSDEDDTYTFSSSDTKIDFREQRRMMRVKLRSNTAGGNFEAGAMLAHVQPGDGR